MPPATIPATIPANSHIESMTRRLAALRQGRGASAAAEFPSLGGTRGP